MRDLHNNINVTQELAPTLITTTDQVVTDVDLSGYESAEFVVSCGVSGDAAPDFQIKVEHSDDGTTYTNCDASDLIGVTSISSGIISDAAAVFDDGTNGHDIGSGDGTAHSFNFGYIGGKRYVQVTIDEDGTNTNGTTFNIISIKGHPKHAPVS